MKKLIICFFIAASTLVAQKEGVNPDLLYGKTGVHLEQNIFEDVTKLFDALKEATQEELSQAAQLVLNKLQSQHTQLRSEIKKLQEHNQLVPQELFFKDFLLENQINHFKNFIKYTDSNSSLWQQVAKKIGELYSNATRWFETTQNNTPTQQLSNQLAKLILKYIDIEREFILFDYQQLLLFFVLRKKMIMPTIIDFWNTTDLQERVKKRAKKISPPKVQFVEMLANIAIQAIIMAGGSLAIQWEDDTDKQAFDEATKQQNAITDDWKLFQKQIANDQTATMGSITNAFGKSQKQVTDLYAKTNQQLQEEVIYLNRSINLDAPIIKSLVSPIQYDLYFENGVMLTPPSGLQWYNIYQVAQGDWEFDFNRNSFWQNGLALFPKPIWQKRTDKTASIFTDDPAANSIFTEYATGSSTYDIEVECTLVNATYPFFVGIICNRGHWISGDPERIWQYRLFGLYGVEITKGDPKSRKVDLCFAQQIINKKQGQTKERIISPLEQIATQGSTHLYQLDKQDVDFLVNNPITYIFKITTSPTIAACFFAKINADATQTPLFSKTISQLDNYLFIFGGIGFMASGCQAEFKIKQPTDLVYSQDQLTEISQQVAALMK